MSVKSAQLAFNYSVFLFCFTYGCPQASTGTEVASIMKQAPRNESTGEMMQMAEHWSVSYKESTPKIYIKMLHYYRYGQ